VKRHNLAILEALPIGITAVLTIFIIIEFRHGCLVIHYELLKNATGFSQNEMVECKRKTPYQIGFVFLITAMSGPTPRNKKQLLMD